MRRLLTQVGEYDWCVSEFIRVTNQLVPAHVIYGYCPELLQGGRTTSGTPLHVQFLGNDPTLLAENAAHAVALGAPAIDLNFGCPAKTVNKHRGGAVLLDETELLYQIVSAVRRAVPAHIPVSAKMRLGYMDNTPALANALAIEAAGAAWLTVHARTKADAYRPPAYWDLLAPLREQLKIPLIANGEIWTTSDAARCQAESGCIDLMLGRGAVTRPDLVNQIRGRPALTWATLLQLQHDFLQAEAKSEQSLVGRYKQWLGMLTQGYPEAQTLWESVKKNRDLGDIRAMLQRSQQP